MKRIHSIYFLALSAWLLTACNSESNLPSSALTQSVQTYVADNYPDVAIDNIATVGNTVTATLSSGEELSFDTDGQLLAYFNKAAYGLSADSLDVCSDSTAIDSTQHHGRDHGRGHHGKGGKPDLGQMGKHGKGRFGNPGLQHHQSMVAIDSLPASVNTFISTLYANCTVIHARLDTICAGPVLKVMVCDSVSEPVTLVFDESGNFLMKGLRIHYADVPTEVSTAITGSYPDYTVSKRCTKYLLVDNTVEYKVYLMLQAERKQVTLKTDGSIVCER